MNQKEEYYNLEYYNKYYIKNKHIGTDSSCVYIDDEIKIKIYGVNENDHSKDETGYIHIHIFTKFGESEYYVDCVKQELTYKDGYILSDDYINNTHHILLSDEGVAVGVIGYDAIYTSWYFENQDNIKTITYHNNQH